MAYKVLYIFVEGTDDERFFQKVIVPLFSEQYSSVVVRTYAKEKDDKVDKFIESIKKIPTAEYLFVADYDNGPCITQVKQKLQQKYKSVEVERIIVVKKEIESWYLAGLTNHLIKAKDFKSTDSLTKEQFNQLMSDRFDSRIDFMVEVLKGYSVEQGKERNSSFNYMINKWTKA